MREQFTRRQMMTRGGIALGMVGLGVLPACSGTDSGNPDGGASDGGSAAGPQVANFPYEQFMPAGYTFDMPAVKEAAYHAYWNGGCCHAVFSAIIGHLSTTVGAPFSLLPLDFGKFGEGGIAKYGSICGTVLGGVLVMNFVVADTTVRSAMLTDLMRWYERTPFPQYVPQTIDPKEKGLSLDFSPSNIVHLQVTPHSHLCHASLSAWSAENHVAATSVDRLARCARLSADVSGRVMQMLEAYLANHVYQAASVDATTQSCIACHPPASTTYPTSTGMECAACHADKTTGHPWAG